MYSVDSGLSRHCFVCQHIWLNCFHCHCSHLLLKCRVATNISLWLKLHSRPFKNYIYAKSVFWSAFGFAHIAFVIPSYSIIVPFLTLWMLFFQYHQDVEQFGSWPGPTFCQALSGSKLFAKVISRWHKSLLAVGKELNTEQVLDTTFWLKPWLKSISFGSS